jgi:hypothetical protein
MIATVISAKMWSHRHSLTTDEQASCNLIMHKVDWKDSTPERRLAIMNLIEKYPHIPHPAGDDTAEPPSSSVPPSQRPDIPGMSSDVFTQPAWNASSKTRKAWREGCKYRATGSTRVHGNVLADIEVQVHPISSNIKSREFLQHRG